MKRGLLRRLSRSVAAADDASSCSSTATAFQQLRTKTKKEAVGHVPVCVGEEGGPVELFVVRTELLGEPAFAALLRRAELEYRYAHPGRCASPAPSPSSGSASPTPPAATS